jgi:hypothetical protein
MYTALLPYSLDERGNRLVKTGSGDMPLGAGRAKRLTSENRPGDPPGAVLFSGGGLNNRRPIDFLRQFCLNRRNRGSIRDHASRRGRGYGRPGIMKAAPFVFIVLFIFAAPPVRAETINVSDSHGGSVAQYNARWAGLAQRGVSVRIVGPCQSACTVLLGHIPASRICVTADASFGFHLAHLPQATATLWSAYSPGHQSVDQRAWRPHARIHLDAGPGHLSLFPQMLSV